MDGAERAEALTDLLRALTAAALGHQSADAVDPTARLTDLGVSSFGALEVSRGLRQATGLAVPAAAVFEHPTLRDLAGHIAALPDWDTVSAAS